MFDRYYRVEDVNNKHISGFGIRLYFSRYLEPRGGESEIYRFTQNSFDAFTVLAKSKAELDKSGKSKQRTFVSTKEKTLCVYLSQEPQASSVLPLCRN
ncbi:MAG: hypothetical protein ABIR72_04000 [Mucilaginibacter sp.]